MTIPSELIQYRQWICWKSMEVNGRRTKVPISPWNGFRASCDRRHTWSTYRHACVAMARFECDGIGFVFTDADPFTGIDLDDCRGEIGNWNPDAIAILNRLNSFSEFSPSGKGAHIIVKAKLPAGRHPKGIGMFDTLRYFTMTGNLIPGVPAVIEERQKEVDELYVELFPAPALPVNSYSRPNGNGRTDTEILDKARTARNGDKFTRLWNGDMSDVGGDWSAADLALCRLLAYWADGDAERVDSLFRQSGLMRDKWDARRPGGTYGWLTISKAIEGRRAA